MPMEQPNQLLFHHFLGGEGRALEGEQISYTYGVAFLLPNLAKSFPVVRLAFLHYSFSFGQGGVRGY